MLRLDLKRSPYDLDLGHGVTVTVRPLSSALMMAARAESLGEDDDGTGLAFLRTLGRLAILAWEGVGDEDGQPIDPTPEAIDAFFDVYVLARAFERYYLEPALLLEEEKNASAPSPNGTMAGADDIAPPVPAPAPTAPQS